MISILIPTYNYNITGLVKELHRQLTASQTVFEIICFEDGSDDYYVSKNNPIKGLPHTNLILSEINLGRVKARNILCEKASFDWLLFLDADVFPKRDSFILDYLSCLNKPYDAFYGGFSYSETPPSKSHMLRWKYGRKYEEVAAQIRNNKPYKVIISANFLVKKQIFKRIISNISYNIYGLDSYIGAKLKEQQIKILHIDNEVVHLGIEKSKIFLNKKEQASEVLIKLIKEHGIINHDNSLLALFLKLKKYKLNYIFSAVFKAFKTSMKRNLLSKNPSITLLQFYRISYMCYKDLNPET